MTISFSGDELINTAIDIERRGVIFYDIMAKSTENAVARDIFHGLSDMERQHIKVFENMRDESGKEQPMESYAGEYAAYLQSLAESAVFSDDLVASELATQADSDLEALELSINAEKDSILFYYEMRGVVPKRAIAVVDRIIAEEKSHLQQLSELKKQVALSQEQDG